MGNLLRGRRLFQRKTKNYGVVTPSEHDVNLHCSTPKRQQSKQIMHRMFLNPDILVLICVCLETIPDRLALRAVSRWCRALLKNAIYTHVVLRPDGPSLHLLRSLIEEPSRCGAILHMDLWLSLRSRFYVPGRDDIPQLWRQREEFTRSIRTVLGRASGLQRICIKQGHNEEPLPNVLSFEGESGVLPFKLKSCSIAAPIPGTLDFIGTQAGITHLVLPEKSDYSIPQNDWPFGFPPKGHTLKNLSTLWATPRWMRALLMRSPIHTFGLMRASPRIDTWGSDTIMLNLLLQAFGEIGGHPTIRCLALPFQDFFMSTSGMDLQALSKGFSKTQKLAITLEPAERVSTLVSTASEHFNTTIYALFLGLQQWRIAPLDKYSSRLCTAGWSYLSVCS
ncbi:hypothetical protein FRC08_013696 [Ceratobasidium sp. 394]|nr:hypothetical protein FRC08_013696 [Ceratobasidium sp. 394]